MRNKFFFGALATFVVIFLIFVFFAGVGRAQNVHVSRHGNSGVELGHLNLHIVGENEMPGNTGIAATIHNVEEVNIAYADGSDDHLATSGHSEANVPNVWNTVAAIDNAGNVLDGNNIVNSANELDGLHYMGDDQNNVVDRSVGAV